MTKREALEMTIKMWTYIAEHNCNKMTAIAALKLPKMMNDCPCCEVTITEPYSSCIECPITWFDGLQSAFSPCVQHGSPYQAWIESLRKKDRIVHARSIVALAQKALDNLTEEIS